MGWRWRLLSTSLAAALLLAACTVSTGPGNGGGTSNLFGIQIRVPADSWFPGGVTQCDTTPVDVYVVDGTTIVASTPDPVNASNGRIDLQVADLPAGSYWIYVQGAPISEYPGRGDCQGVSGGLYLEEWAPVTHVESGSTHVVRLSRLAAVSGTLEVDLDAQPLSIGITPLDSRATPAGETVPGEVIVKFKAVGQGRAATAAEAAALAPASLQVGLATRLDLVRTIGTGAALYRSIGGITQPARLAAALAQRPDVEYAEPNYIRKRLAIPDDTLYGQQWHYPFMGLEDAWEVTVGGDAGDASTTRPRIAILDTGRLPHVDLPPSFLECDFVGRDDDALDPGPGSDTGWHGTHVAGTVGASTNNGQGVAGVIWNAQILHGRVLGAQGGTDVAISEGILWAAGAGLPGDLVGVCALPDQADQATVINLSLGGPGYSRTMQEAIAEATAFGALVVAAAGNSDQDAGGFTPANLDNVLTVAALGPTGERAWYSNYGDTIDLAAPGGDQSSSTSDGVLSTLNADGYAFYQGTSMASPHVAGTAALVQHAQGITSGSWIRPWELTRLLLESTITAGISCPDPKTCGTGLLRADAAVSQAAWPDTVTTDTLIVDYTTGDPVVEQQFTLTNESTGDVTLSLVPSSGAISVSPAGPVTLGTGESELFTVTVATQPADGTYFGRIDIGNADFLLQVTVYYTETGGGAATEDYESAYVLAIEDDIRAPGLFTGIWIRDPIPAGEFTTADPQPWAMPPGTSPPSGTEPAPGVIPTNQPLLYSEAYTGPGFSEGYIAGGSLLGSAIHPNGEYPGVDLVLFSLGALDLAGPRGALLQSRLQSFDPARAIAVLSALAELRAARPAPVPLRVTPR